MRIVPGEALRDRQGLLLPAGVTGSTPDSGSGDFARSYLARAAIMGDGTAWGGHHTCNVKIRWIQFPYPPPCSYSSAGRARLLQSRGREFEPLYEYHYFSMLGRYGYYGALIQFNSGSIGH